MQAYIEKEDSKKLKQKQRERMQPKMGKMDIDYQVSSLFTFFLILHHFLSLHTFMLLSEVNYYNPFSSDLVSWLSGSS